MELKEFIGKTVINTKSQERYTLREITSPYLEVVSQTPNKNGCYPSYRLETINGDPITEGILVFEDASLTEAFRIAYDAYCHTQEAYYEEIGYWAGKD